jgi:hypothetical protein
MQEVLVVTLLKKNWLLVSALVIFSIIVLSQWNFVPFYDGAGFFEHCFQKFAEVPFSSESLMCFDHPAFVPTLLYGTSQIFFYGEVWPTLLISWLLGISSILCVHKTINILFPATDWPIAGAGSLLYSLNPALLASIINPNLDFPVLVFSTWMFAALVSKHYRLAAAAGILMVLSKESGLLSYGIIVGIWSLFFVTPDLLCKSGVMKIIKHKSVLALPPTVFFVYVAWRHQQEAGQVLHTGGGIKEILAVFLDVRFTEPHMLAYAATALGINFQWIFTLSLLCLPVAALFLTLTRKGKKVSLQQFRNACFLGTLLLCLTYFLVRYPYYNNPRYFLPLLPLLTISAIGAWYFLFPLRFLRFFCTLGMSCLLGISVFHTVDPFARWYFGTFLFGKKEVLSMTSMTQECCAQGRDQLTYNLQFTRWHYLIDQILSEIPKDKPMLVHHYTDFFLLFYRDPIDGRRTMKRPGAIKTKVFTVTEMILTETFPPEVYALDQPNIEWDILQVVGKQQIPYHVTSSKQTKWGPYRMTYWKLSRIPQTKLTTKE